MTMHTRAHFFHTYTQQMQVYMQKMGLIFLLSKDVWICTDAPAHEYVGVPSGRKVYNNGKLM